MNDMARRKKRTDNSQEKIRICANDSIAVEDDKEVSPPVVNGETVAYSCRNAQKGFSSWTFWASVFLAFLLGVYIGTLFPEISRELSSNQKFSAGSPPAQPEIKEQQTTAPKPQVAKGGMQIPDELAKEISSLEKSLVRNAGSARDWIALGNLYFDTSQVQKAIGAYEHALSIQPENPDVLTDLGIMYRESGAFTKAVQAFEKAIEINPVHENALFNAGVVLFNDLGKRQEALTAWKKLVKINSNARTPDGRLVSDMIKQIH